jgi:hypothetical protein
MRLTLSFLALFLLQGVLLKAGGDSLRTERYYVGASGGYGFLWAHNPAMASMVNDHIISGEIRLTRQTCGMCKWERDFHLPECGISVLGMNLGDKKQLGYGFAVMPFINFPLGERERKLKMHFYLGWGPGWITRIFDPETNHQNNAIGSHLNACIRLRLNAQRTVGEKIILEGGLELTHFSNGASKFPNLGVNLPAITLGLHYFLSESLQKNNGAIDRTDLTGEISNRWSTTVCLSVGINALDVESPKRYGAYNLLTALMWQLSDRHKFGGGIDVMYSSGIKERRLRRGDDVTSINNLQPGVKVCYELILGKMSWPFEVGTYLYSPFLINGSVYTRFGIRYHVTEHACFGMSLKANMTAAEYFEVYAGWKF